jgi:hypothetical protein
MVHWGQIIYTALSGRRIEVAVFKPRALPWAKVHWPFRP